MAQHSPPRSKQMLSLRSPLRWPSRRLGECGSLAGLSWQDRVRTVKRSRASPKSQSCSPNSRPWRAMVGLLKGPFLLKHHLGKGLGAASRQAGSLTSSQMGWTGTWALKRKTLAFPMTFPLFGYHRSCLTLSEACNGPLPQFPHL